MKITREKTENRQAFLKVEVEPAEMEEATNKSYQRLLKKVDVPGFRRGKAPRAVLERHIGQESVMKEVLDDLLPEAYEKAVREQELEPIARPEIEVVETNPLVFTAVVPLEPVVNLGDYHSIKESPETVEITDEQVNAVIEQLRHQHSTWGPAERPVEFGDLLTIDIEGDIEGNADGEPFISHENVQFQVMRDANYPAPGFTEHLIGMSKNQGKEFTIKLPEDYPRKEVAGKEAVPGKWPSF